MSLVEEALRSQASVWRDVAERVCSISNREFPSEPPKRILIFGVGSSHFAAQLMAYTLGRDRSRPRLPVLACSSMAIGNEIVPQRGDWAFAVSHRGTTASTLAAIEICQRSSVFTVLVSGRGVRAPETVQLQFETCDLEKSEPHTVSMTSAICAVTTHFLGTKIREEWEALGAIGFPPVEIMQRRVGHGPSLLLGEWEGEWLAREGALKLMEMARLPVRAFGTEEYFHGPRFSVKPDDVIWQVVHAKDRRASEIKAGYRFNINGSTPLAWVPTLLEMQMAALAVAANLGADPDVPEART
jgi:glucosamine 6-phosphate synthetase-like amidotransferase/phosphosugar isomerase protein